jgi:hypothetical protein
LFTEGEAELEAARTHRGGDKRLRTRDVANSARKTFRQSQQAIPNFEVASRIGRDARAKLTNGGMMRANKQGRFRDKRKEHAVAH